MSIYARIKKKFDGFSLDVEFEADGERLALLGASGCGKSMTLKCIAGIVRPDEGKIVVNGKVFFDSSAGINLPPQRRHVGLLFQSRALFPNMTVRENIGNVLKLAAKHGDIAARIASLAARFRFAGLEGRYPSELSGGQQQRVALARIMASEPSIMLLDEPFTALDSYIRWKLEDELVSLLDGFGGTTLYVSHDRDEVYRICDRVCVVSDGKSEPVRAVREIFVSPVTYAAAQLSGCKNYSRAYRIASHKVRAIDWNVDISCGEEIPDDVVYVGVRAHFVTLAAKRSAGGNELRCRVLRVAEGPFSAVVNLLPDGAQPDGDMSLIRMELDRRAPKLAPGDAVKVMIAPHDVMVLRDR